VPPAKQTEVLRCADGDVLSYNFALACADGDVLRLNFSFTCVHVRVAILVKQCLCSCLSFPTHPPENGSFVLGGGDSDLRVVAVKADP